MKLCLQSQKVNPFEANENSSTLSLLSNRVATLILKSTTNLFKLSLSNEKGSRACKDKTLLLGK